MSKTALIALLEKSPAGRPASGTTVANGYGSICSAGQRGAGACPICDVPLIVVHLFEACPLCNFHEYL